jgi:hypothetical protein
MRRVAKRVVVSAAALLALVAGSLLVSTGSANAADNITKVCAKGTYNIRFANELSGALSGVIHRGDCALFDHLHDGRPFLVIAFCNGQKVIGGFTDHDQVVDAINSCPNARIRTH